MSTAYIGIGSNLGDRQKNIEIALEKLKARRGVEFKKASSIIETEPQGNTQQPKFLNCVCRLETSLYPDELFDCLKSIERELGRKGEPPNTYISREEQLRMLQEGTLDFNSLSKPVVRKQDEQPQKWGPRTIDLDILFYDDVMMKGNNLIIPHPLLHERLFVLKPLAEIAPDLIHPVLGKSIKELLSGLSGPSIPQEGEVKNETDQISRQDV